MPSAASDSLNSSWLHCGCLREEGKLRTSASALIPFKESNSKKSPIVSVECPTVQIFVCSSFKRDCFPDGTSIRLTRSDFAPLFQPPHKWPPNSAARRLLSPVGEASS